MTCCKLPRISSILVTLSNIASNASFSIITSIMTTYSYKFSYLTKYNYRSCPNLLLLLWACSNMSISNIYLHTSNAIHTFSVKYLHNIYLYDSPVEPNTPAGLVPTCSVYSRHLPTCWPCRTTPLLMRPSLS